MAASDAKPVPQKNTAYRVVFPILDADGDLVTGAVGTEDAEVSLDEGTFADTTNAIVEIATASGMYYLDLTAAEMNTDCTAVIVKHAVAGGKTTPIVLYPEETGDINVDVTAWLGTAAATPTVAGVPEVDVTHWIGTAAATPTVAGVPEVDITHFGGTAGTFAAGRPEVNTTHWIGTAAATPTVAGVPEIDVTHWLGTAAAAPTVAGVPEVDVTHWIGTAASTPTTPGVPEVDLILWLGAAPTALAGGSRVDCNIGAIGGTAAVATTLEKCLTGMKTGTADSGSTTTLVDAERTEADTDYWKGSIVLFTTGNNIGQARLITAFDAATDTITYAPATTNAVTTHGYILIPHARVDIHSLLSSVINPLISGRVDSNVQVMANDVITAAVIANDAIGATEIANGAIDAATFAAGAITATVIADGAIDSATFTAGAINSTVIATDTFDADALAADAVAKIKNAILPPKNIALPDIEFLMVDATDFTTPETGLTITGTRSIDGGAFGACTGTFSEIGNGIYAFDSSASDMNGTIITFRFTSAGAADTFLTLKTGG